MKYQKEKGNWSFLITQKISIIQYKIQPSLLEIFTIKIATLGDAVPVTGAATLLQRLMTAN